MNVALRRGTLVNFVQYSTEAKVCDATKTNNVVKVRTQTIIQIFIA